MNAIHQESSPRVGIVWFRLLLTLSSAEGILALVFSFAEPSMARRAFLFGYSLERLLVGTGLFMVCAAVGFAAINAWRSEDWARQVLRAVDDRMFGSEDRKAYGVVAILFALLVGTYTTYLFEGYGLPNAPYAMKIAVHRFLFPVLWLIACLLQSVIFMAIRYRDTYQRVFTGPRGLPYLVLLLVLSGTGVHLVTVIFRSDLWFRIPGWFWVLFPPKPLKPSQLFLMAATIIGCFAVRSVMRKPLSEYRNILVCVTLAWVLQMAFGFALGGGFESIRLKYANSALSDIVRYACQAQGSLVGTVRNYEGLYGQQFWLGTKPPGLLVLYQAARNLIGRFDPNVLSGSESCFFTMTSWFAVILPLMAALTVVPLYLVEGILAEGPERWASTFLFISAPNVLLMTLLPDQFLYPLLAVGTVLALAVALSRPSFGAGVLAGCLIYLSAFVTFSLLPLVGLAIFWVGLERRLPASPNHRFDVVRLLVAMSIGVLALWVLGVLLLDYDPIARYRLAFEQHRALKQFELTPSRLVEYARLNTVEFVIWAGWPLIVLAAAGWIGAISGLLKKIADKKDVYSVSVLATLFGISLLGQTRGEVGRLWIFLVPLIAVVSSKWATRILGNPARGMTMVFLLQMTIASVGFLFLDFR